MNKDESAGTHLECNVAELVTKKKWIANNLRSKGKVYIDSGAEEAIVFNGKSLLAAGVIRVEGKFNRGEIVRCINTKNKEIAKGLVNYSSEELGKIAGYSSEKIESLLGYINESNLIHRDNMVIFFKEKIKKEKVDG